MHRQVYLFSHLSKALPRWAITIFTGLCAGLLIVPQTSYAGSIGATVNIANAPTTVPLGETFSLDLIFDNNSTATGFGPYINLFVPKSGADGDDGYTFSAASYLGAPVTAITVDCPAGSSITSPLTGLPVVCPNLPSGTHQLVILQLPFGSFAPNQPPAPVQVSFTMSDKADVGVALPISAQAGFVYGSSAIGAEPSASSVVSASVAPSLLTLTKDYRGLEGETTTGPNYPRSFLIRANMPTGMTATTILITDTLPNNIVYLGTSDSGFTVLQQPAIGSGPFSTPPSNNLLVLSVPGNLIGDGPNITVNYYVTATASTGTSVLGSSGTPSQTINIANAQVTWTPLDVRDSGSLITTTATSSHRDLALAMQKFVSNADLPNSPNDDLTYRLSFQVSDFLTVGGIVITDTLANGHDYVPSSAQISVTDRAGNVVGALPITATTIAQLLNGDTRLVFDVSAAMQALGAADGVLQGGRAIAPNSSAASGQLIYRATISDQYHGSNAALQPNDILTNTAQIGGVVLGNNAPLTNVLGSVSDSTQVTLALAAPTLTKRIYAINGNPVLSSPLKISPDDEVTYLLRYDMPTGDFRNLTLTDYLPLPMFNATTLTAFISSTNGIPAVGSAQWAATMSNGDLSRIAMPTLNTDAEQNAVAFGFGTRDDPSNTPTQIVILFTVKASAQPYVDDLYFTNQVSAQQENNDGHLSVSSAIVPFRSAVPQLRIRKGIVSASNPQAAVTQTMAGPVLFTPAGTGTCANRFSGVIRSTDLATTPIDGNLINADAGDTVRYAIVIENIGSGQLGAFDVALRDALPANLSYRPNSLCVQSGNGNLLATTEPSTTLFTSGLTLTTVLSRGQDYAGVMTTTGNNIAVISFDALIGSAITPTQQLTNTATLQNYASVAGGANFVPIHPPSNPISDTARVSFNPPRLEKRLAASEFVNASNANAQVVLGELVTYTLVLTVPEGTLPLARITDTLPSGLIFQACDSVGASNGVTSTLGDLDAATVCASVASGSSPTFDLGTLLNSNTDDGIAETVAITFRAVVLNSAANVTGTTLSNSAVFNGQGNQPISASDANLKVIRPQLTVAKSVTPRAGDAGDALTYLITVTNPSANSTMAYDVVLTDVVPTGLTYVNGSWANVSGVAGVLMASAPTLTATWAQITPGQSSVVSFTVTLNSNVAPNQTITNTTQAGFTSLPGLTNTQRSIYSVNAMEQSGNTSAAAAAIVVPPVTIGKTLLGTEISNANNSNTRAVIGELVTYTVVVTVPEGVTPNAVITDNLPTGLAFVSFINASLSPDLQMSAPMTALLAPTVTPASGTTAGNRAVWALGTITNTNGNNAIGETLQITFTAMVLNVAGNVAGQTKANQAQFAWAGNTTALVSSASVTLIEPVMGLSKTVTPTLGDSGDTITYTLVLTGPSGADAFDGVLFDALPVTHSGSLILSPTLASVSSNTTPAINLSDFTLSGNNSAGYVLHTASPLDLSLNANRAITLTITGVLAENVLPSGYITNTAQITYTSLDGFAQPITRSGYNANSIERNYTRTATISSRINPLDAQKVLIGTSEDNTGLGPDGLMRVEIGEVVAYRMMIRMAEGTSPNLVLDLLDNLPSGLQYVPDSARVGFVANGRGITSSVITNALPGCNGLTIGAGAIAAVPANAITCPFPSNQISFDVNGRPKFSLGAVANLDTDHDDEYVIVQLSAVVLNQLSNQSGTLLPNTMDVMVNGRIEDTSEPITVTVAEPALRMSKIVNEASTLDGADGLTYTVMISNGNGANISAAFDVLVTDVLDSNLEVISASLSAPNIITRYTSVSDLLVTDTQRITATLGQLDPNTAATLTVWARVRPTATNGGLIPNMATLSYSSLPTLTGSISNAIGIVTPGASGTISGERTSAGGVNDYAASSGVSVTLNTPSVIKLAPSQSQYAIGDDVTYTLWITVPEGVAQAVSLLDDLPPGLGYVRSQVVATGYDGLMNLPVVTQPNGDVAWAFGNITTTADNDGSNDDFAIQVVAQVLNHSAPINQNGSVLSNGAWLTYSHPLSGVQSVNGGVQAISVIEPSLQINKRVVAARQPVGANDGLTYVLGIRNTGSATAHDVVITDALPSGMRFVATQQISVGNSAISTDTNHAGDRALGWQLSRLEVGQTAWVTYTAQVDANVSARQSLLNVAQVFYSSLPEVMMGERTYTSTQASASVNTGMPSVGIVKQVNADIAQVSDVLTYTMTVSNRGDVMATDVVITDQLPTNTSYIGSEPGAVQADGWLTWTLGGLAANSERTVTLTVRVDGLVDNGTILSNEAWVSAGNGGVITPSSQVQTRVAYADVYVRKSVQPTRPVMAGETLTWTLDYGNAGTASARAVLITDVLPSEVDFGGILNAGDLSMTVTLPQLRWFTPTLAAGGSGQIVFTTTAKIATSPQVMITNTVDITTSSPQTATAVGNEHAEAVTPKIDSAISKTAARSVVAVGEWVSYTILISNTGGVVLNQVPLMDRFDARYLSYVSAQPSPTSVSAGQLKWANVGPIAVGARASVVVTFTAQAAILNTRNEVTATGESTGTVLPVMSSAADIRITQPRLGVRKFSANDGGNPLRSGERVTYTIVVRNEGDADATDVSISDTLPALTTWVSDSLSVQPSNTDATLGAPPLLAQHAVVRAGQAITLSYVAMLTSPLANGSVLVNRVAISNSNGGVMTATDSVSDVVISAHTLMLEKWAEPRMVATGQIITYGLRYTITGDAPASNVVLTDALPAQTTLVSCVGCRANGQTLHWALGNVAPPMTGILTLSVRAAAILSASAGSTAIITNVAVIGDDAGQQAMAQASVSVGSHAELSIRKSVAPAIVRHGDMLTYTLVVHNDGPSDTSSGESIVMPGNNDSTIGPAAPYPSVLRVSDLGAITDITVSINGIQHSYAGDLDVLLVGPQGQKIMLMSDVGGIYPATDVSLNFHEGAPLLPDADALTSGTYRPTNYIANDGIETMPAPAPGLPYATALSELVGTSANGDWQLFVMDDQKNDEGVFIRGWALTLETTTGSRVFATNAGGLISDWLPPGLQVLNVQPGFAAGNLALWSTSLAAGETKTYTVLARVWHGATVLMTNTATITGTQPEDELRDNISIATVPVMYTDLAITITTPVSYTPGTSVRLPITISNGGNLTVTQGVVTITLPPGMTLTELPPGWRDRGGGVYEVPIGVLPPGGVVAIELPVTISPILPPGMTLPVVVAVGDVDAPDADVDPDNNSDTADTPINTDVQLALWKASVTEAHGGLMPGDVITYRLWVSNTSGFAATQVIVRDALPDGTVYVEGSGQPAPTREGNTLVWQVPTLGPYAAMQIEFAVMVSTTSTAQMAVVNTFTVDSDETALQMSNEVEDPYKPTAIDLAYLRATWISATQVHVAWKTTLEIDTWGFDLYRSTDGVREHAAKVTPNLIAAVGRNGGATYGFADERVAESQGYFYWLVEAEVDGRQRDYEPIFLPAQSAIENRSHLYLPVLLK